MGDRCGAIYTDKKLDPLDKVLCLLLLLIQKTRNIYYENMNIQTLVCRRMVQKSKHLNYYISGFPQRQNIEIKMT